MDATHRLARDLAAERPHRSDQDGAPHQALAWGAATAPGRRGGEAGMTRAPRRPVGRRAALRGLLGLGLVLAACGTPRPPRDAGPAPSAGAGAGAARAPARPTDGAPPPVAPPTRRWRSSGGATGRRTRCAGPPAWPSTRAASSPSSTPAPSAFGASTPTGGRWPAGAAPAPTRAASTSASPTRGGPTRTRARSWSAAASPSTRPAPSTSPTPATGASRSSTPTAGWRAPGPAGADGGPAARPFGLAVDRQGRVYVADRDDDCVRVYDASGARLAPGGARARGPARSARRWRWRSTARTGSTSPTAATTASRCSITADNL